MSSLQAERRPDRSMSLLVDVMTNTLDPAYRDRAQRRSAQSAESTHRPRAGVLGVALLVLLGLLTGTAVAAVRARQQAGAGLRSELGAQARAQAGATDALAAQAEELRADVDRVRATTLGADAQGRQSASLLAALGVASATTAVGGPGVVVTLDDAPAGDVPSDPRTPDALAQGRVQDRDLQDAVNALWAAGAEAVAVNGQRLTAVSAIRSAGQTVLVDFTLLSPPYRIQAIGDTDALQFALVDGPTGRRLQTLASVYGLSVEVRRADALQLPAAGLPTLRNALPAGPP